MLIVSILLFGIIFSFFYNRNLNEIPKDKLHIIASGRLEKNVGIRFLRQKGFQVVGYTITKENHLKSC